MFLGPRVVVAGTHSGVGKTTVATGLMAAFARRGKTVASAKVGPDYIDPGYHALATGRPPRNLDAWMCGLDAMGPLAGRAGSDAELLVIEGVMGLFDGAADLTPSSTADVARELEAPVILVVDAAAMSSSVAALVNGFASFDESVPIAGVVLNRVGSNTHAQMLRRALAPLAVEILGVIHRDDALTWRDRHLGLVPVVEHPETVRRSLDRLAHVIESSLDLDAIEKVAAASSRPRVAEPPLPPQVRRARVAVAGGPAFSFLYPDNLEALEAAGAEIAVFDPLTAVALPVGCDALIAGGGFPETYAAGLAANEPLNHDVRTRVAAGLVVWAECGGLLWLSAALDGKPMAGVIDTAARMTSNLTLGYRQARTRRRSPLGPTGTRLRGHEFHYSSVDPPGDGLELESREGRAVAGYASDRLMASYLHLHLGAAPDIAANFLGATALRVPYVGA